MNTGAASKLAEVTWEGVACIVFVLFMIGPDLPGSDDPIEFCLTRMNLTSVLSFFNMLISFFGNFFQLTA